MKKYLGVYMGSEIGNTWNSLSPDEQKMRGEKGMAAWGQWVEKYKKSIVVFGGPLGKTKKVDREGIHNIKNMMTGYVVVEAGSHDEAAKMFLEHPHFTIFPGDSVEVMECNDIPGM